MKRGAFRVFCLLLAATALPATALEFNMPTGARLTVERTTALDSFNAPIGPYLDDQIPFETVEGAVSRRAWRLPAEGLTPLQIMAPLREILLGDGFQVIFECEAAKCGGFDFRFGVEVLPGPNMYVNISRYRFLTAIKRLTDVPDRVVSILATTTAASAYVQIIAVDANGAPAWQEADETPSVPDQQPIVLEEDKPAASLAQAIEQHGHVILHGLDFATGSTDLGAGPYNALQELSDFMNARSGLRVALVGHTDATGTLGTNIALSRARAVSVRTRLVEQYGIDPERLDAEGMGYLAPIATNATASGRERNRRVEAVLLDAE